MPEKAIPKSTYGAKRYNITEAIDFNVALKYSTALLAIAGADGKLHDEELEWYLEEQRLLGGTDAYLEAVKSANWKHANVEELLGQLHYDFSLNARHAMLYQSIKMCRADGEFHEKERAAVQSAARTLKVAPAVVAQLEALAEMEDAAEKMRLAIFRAD